MEGTTKTGQNGQKHEGLCRVAARSAGGSLCPRASLVLFSLVPPACPDRFFDDVPNHASPFSVRHCLVDQVEDVL